MCSIVSFATGYRGFKTNISKGRLEDALVLRDDEGRDKLR